MPSDGEAAERERAGAGGELAVVEAALDARHRRAAGIGRGELERGVGLRGERLGPRDHLRGGRDQVDRPRLRGRRGVHVARCVPGPDLEAVRPARELGQGHGAGRARRPRALVETAFEGGHRGAAEGAAAIAQLCRPRRGDGTRTAEELGLGRHRVDRPGPLHRRRVDVARHVDRPDQQRVRAVGQPLQLQLAGARRERSPVDPALEPRDAGQCVLTDQIERRVGRVHEARRPRRDRRRRRRPVVLDRDGDR